MIFFECQHTNEGLFGTKVYIQAICNFQSDESGSDVKLLIDFVFFYYFLSSFSLCCQFPCVFICWRLFWEKKLQSLFEIIIGKNLHMIEYNHNKIVKGNVIFHYYLCMSVYFIKNPLTFLWMLMMRCLDTHFEGKKEFFFGSDWILLCKNRNWLKIE